MITLYIHYNSVNFYDTGIQIFIFHFFNRDVSVDEIFFLIEHFFFLVNSIAIQKSFRKLAGLFN